MTNEKAMSCPSSPISLIIETGEFYPTPEKPFPDKDGKLSIDLFDAVIGHLILTI